MDQLDVFAATHPKVWAIAIELRLCTRVLTRFVERLMVLATAATSQREIECDSIEPSKESAVALERIELEIGLDERFLHDILGLVGIPDDADHGRIETVLVAEYEGFKGGALAVECPLNQIVFVVHSLDQNKWISWEGKEPGSEPSKIIDYI